VRPAETFLKLRTVCTVFYKSQINLKAISVDITATIDYLVKQFGPTLAIVLAAGGYLYTQRNASKKEGADADGQVAAIAIYEKLFLQEQAARRIDIERADRLDGELRLANGELWQLKGRFEALNEQLKAQNLHIEQLRKQLDLLQERVVHGG
jgi:hypothetical protein